MLSLRARYKFQLKRRRMAVSSSVLGPQGKASSRREEQSDEASDDSPSIFRRHHPLYGWGEQRRRLRVGDAAALFVRELHLRELRQASRLRLHPVWESDTRPAGGCA